MTVIATPALSRGKQSIVRQAHHDVILSMSKDGSPRRRRPCFARTGVRLAMTPQDNTLPLELERL